jgi:uncharacterized repeat protein (TIGR01451 family)
VNTPVGTAADVSITKTDAPDPVAPGGATHPHDHGRQRRRQRRQHGQLDRRAARFAQLRVARPAPPAGPARRRPWAPSGTVTCNNGSLANGASDAFSLVTNVAFSAAGSSVNNTATVSSSTFDPAEREQIVHLEHGVNAASPALSITKVLSSTNDNDSSSSVTAGDQLNYTVTAKNTGNIPLTGVVVSDDHFPATQSCPALAIGANCVLTGSYTVAGADVSAGSVTNIGSVTSNEAAGPFTSSVNTPVGTAADLSVTKTDSPDPVAPGAQLTHTITVGNSGSAASTVSLTDTLPASLGFVSLTAPVGWTCSTPAPVPAAPSPAPTRRWPTAPATCSPWSAQSPSRPRAAA